MGSSNPRLPHDGVASTSLTAAPRETSATRPADVDPHCRFVVITDGGSRRSRGTPRPTVRLGASTGPAPSTATWRSADPTLPAERPRRRWAAGRPKMRTVTTTLTGWYAIIRATAIAAFDLRAVRRVAPVPVIARRTRRG